MIALLFHYSYFNAFIGSNFAAAKDGNIVAKNVITKEKTDTIKIYLKLISAGILLKKYISSGKSSILKSVVIRILISSI